MEGNAGAGTNGVPGGAGGHINIRVNDNESYYLMAFRCLDNNDAIQKAVRGGDPGKIGKHGSPGQGTTKFKRLEICGPVIVPLQLTKYLCIGINRHIIKRWEWW